MAKKAEWLRKLQAAQADLDHVRDRIYASAPDRNTPFSRAFSAAPEAIKEQFRASERNLSDVKFKGASAGAWHRGSDGNLYELGKKGGRVDYGFSSPGYDQARAKVERVRSAARDAEIAVKASARPADPGIRSTSKPRTPFESPPKGATDGRLRTDRKPTTRPGPAAKPKTPANAAAALDAVTRDAKQVVATERAIKKDASLNTNAVRERTRPTTAKTKAPTVAELKAQAKAQGLKGYSKMTKAQLSQALGNGPAGWSDAAREASAKVRGGNAAPAAAKSAGGTMKALGKVAKAASKGAKVLLPAVAGMAALSAFNESAQAGESTATATGKAVKAGGTTAADMLTGGALTHYDNARAKGISKTSSTIGAIMKGAASVASLGLADLATWAAGSRPTMKAPDVRKASAKQQAIYAAKAKKESAMTAGRKAQPAAKPEGPTGMVAAHRKRVNGKTVSVEARRMTAKEIRARAM